MAKVFHVERIDTPERAAQRKRWLALGRSRAGRVQLTFELSVDAFRQAGLLDVDDDLRLRRDVVRVERRGR